VPHQPTGRIQYGGHQTGSSIISAYMIDRTKIPSDSVWFLGSPNSTEHVPMWCHVSRQLKSNMADIKPELEIFPGLFLDEYAIYAIGTCSIALGDHKNLIKSLRIFAVPII